MIDIFENLFNTLKKNNKTAKTNFLAVDVHSHILPGIDDGSKTMFESVKMVKEMQNLGYKKLIITPHTMSHRYKNNGEIILDKLEALRDALAHKNIEITIEAASEYYLDEFFLALLAKKDILTFGKNYVLFELSYTRAPKDLESVVFDMLLAGYTPVLAHPERFLHMHNDFTMYEKLKEHGVLFQLNINSLAGYYSRNVQKTAEKLVSRGMIDFLGSDVHKLEQIQILNTVMNTSQFQKIFEKNNIINNTLL